MALFCPREGCGGKLKKPKDYGESAWNCIKCGEDWFVMNLPQPKIGNKRRDPIKMKEVQKNRKPITKKEAEKAVKKVKAERLKEK